MSNSAYAYTLWSNSTLNSRHSTLKHVKPQHHQQHLPPPTPSQLPSPLPCRQGRSLLGITRNPFSAALILTYVSTTRALCSWSQHGTTETWHLQPFRKTQTDDCKLYLIFQQSLINVESNVCGLTSVWCIPCAVSDNLAGVHAFVVGSAAGL